MSVIAAFLWHLLPFFSPTGCAVPRCRNRVRPFVSGPLTVKTSNRGAVIGRPPPPYPRCGIYGPLPLPSTPDRSCSRCLPAAPNLRRKPNEVVELGTGPRKTTCQTRPVRGGSSCRSGAMTQMAVSVPTPENNHPRAIHGWMDCLSARGWPRQKF